MVQEKVESQTEEAAAAKAPLRYIYLYLEKAEVIYLFMFYGKNEKDTLSGAEKKEVAALVGQLKEVYEEK
jgi:hypothetical protein